MRRVIISLLIVVQTIFIIDFFIPNGTLSFNVYVWGILTFVTMYAGIKSATSAPNLTEQSEIHYLISLTLIGLSLLSFGFMGYIILLRPHLI